MSRRDPSRDRPAGQPHGGQGTGRGDRRRGGRTRCGRPATSVVDVSGDTAAGRRATGPGPPSPTASTRWPSVGGDGMVHLGVNLCAGTDVAAGHRRRRDRQRHRPRARPAGRTTPRRRPRRHRPRPGAHASTPAGAARTTRRGRRWLVGRAGRRLRRRGQRARQRLALADGRRALQPRGRPRAAGVPADPVRRRGRRAAARDRGDARGGRQRPVVRRGHAGLPGRRPRRRAARRPDRCTSSRSRRSSGSFPEVFTGTHVSHPAVEMHARPAGPAGGDAGSSPTPTASGSARCRSTCEVVPGALRVLAPLT